MSNRISPYWLCQLFGWSLNCLYWIDGMLSCNCISFLNGSINIILTFITGILVTHLHVLVIRKYKLQEENFPKVLLYILFFIVIMSIALWFVNIFINYFTYKEHYYLRESKFNSLFDFALNSFDMFIVFSRMASIWILTYFLYHFGKRSNAAEKEKAELNQLLAESSLNHLKKQVNPHFMFNSLNSIKALINEDPKKANTAVVLLADILRNSLNSNSKQTITLKEELDHCKDYFAMEKIRFEDKLQYEINIHDTDENFLLPPLSILTLVENAVKHGLNESLTKTNISIDCYEEKEGLITTVKNDGTLKKNDSEGTGIKNLKNRFDILYQGNYSFSISEKNDQVIVQFKLPKGKNK